MVTIHILRVPALVAHPKDYCKDLASDGCSSASELDSV
ncbi:predicted protein [Botrytis cinerea T4]|uniref:Uncharacterized protein n=1 Tax=Botryotinia fuckeliana (strain T4) TaxID=999810 RepID=G2YTY5_BOTF4|nr:predicted protein [Botrytis cinerea T4]